MASGPELVEESRVGGGLGAAGFWRERGGKVKVLAGV